METEEQTEAVIEQKFPKSLKYGLIAIPLMISAMIGFNVYMGQIHGREPRSTRYEDRNGDGIEDKIEDERYIHPGIIWSIDSTKERILYGTGTKLNGKKLYLPKEIFDEHFSR